MTKDIKIKPGPGPDETRGFPSSVPPKPNTGQPSSTPPPKPLTSPTPSK